MSSRRHEAPRRVDRPEPGCFLIRLVPKGPLVPAEIVHKRGLWSAVINGRPGEWHADPALAPMVMRVWTGERISRDDYERRVALVGAPDTPRHDRPIDLVATPFVF